MDEVVPCSFALVLAIVAGADGLVLAQDGHMGLMSNEAVVEQVHLDGADAQNDTGFGAILLSQWVALDPRFWVYLMTEAFAGVVEVLKNLHYFPYPASRHGLYVPRSQRWNHFQRCEDQYERFLSPLGPAILLRDFLFAFAAFAGDALFAVLLVVVVA